MNYENYGDADFFQYGVLVAPDNGSEGCFHILYCRPYDDEEDLYQFADCYVDINADWIDKKEVLQYIGAEKDEPSASYAVACIEYYGIDEFRDYYTPVQLSRAEVEEELHQRNLDYFS